MEGRIAHIVETKTGDDDLFTLREQLKAQMREIERKELEKIEEDRRLKEKQEKLEIERKKEKEIERRHRQLLAKFQQMIDLLDAIKKK